MFRHRLRARTAIERNDDTGLSLVTDLRRIDLDGLTSGQTAALLALQDPGATEEALCELVSNADGQQAISWLFLTLIRLAQLGFTELTLTADGVKLATLQPLAQTYQLNDCRIPEGQPVRLCRFSYLHRVDSDMLLESPRSLSRVVLNDARTILLVANLMRPSTPQHCCEVSGHNLSREAAQSFMQLLYGNDFLEIDRAAAPETQDVVGQALEQWEFHDLLFHARSRAGRHRDRWGATYRWGRSRAPLPAVKEVAGEGLALHRPVAVGPAGPQEASFASVMENRRSLRIPGEHPLSKEQLGEFLFRTSRVRGRMRTEHEEVSNRPYPGGGADYELEIYPLIQRVKGIEQGIYYYHPLQHRLHQIGPAEAGWLKLLKDAIEKARVTQLPDVLFCVTGRFQRLTYKYSSIAYAIMLKDLGALYQTFYLVATVMELAPCAIGGGNSDLFAKSTGVDYVVEPYVGEFILSSRNSDEWARYTPPPAH